MLYYTHILTRQRFIILKQLESLHCVWVLMKMIKIIVSVSCNGKLQSSVKTLLLKYLFSLAINKKTHTILYVIVCLI